MEIERFFVFTKSYKKYGYFNGEFEPKHQVREKIQYDVVLISANCCSVSFSFNSIMKATIMFLI